MKTYRWFWVIGVLVFAMPRLFAQQAQPRITAIRQERTNIVVEVQIPAGIRRLTLECRERLGPGAWEPRAVARLDGTGGPVTFRLPSTRQLEVMRVRADANEPLPAAFYAGTNSFYEPATGPVDTRSGVAGPLDATTTPPASDASRAVVESDIWKIRGQTLYF